MWSSNARPTVLIGVSGQAGAFTETVVRTMAQHVDRPVIFPLSNPTSRSEATAEQLVAWTDGRALIGAGSPFAPVEWKGRTIPIDQTNNSYIFPGMGLGILAAGARRVTDAMFMVAAKVLAEMSPTATDKQGRLLPPVDQMRAVAARRRRKPSRARRRPTVWRRRATRPLSTSASRPVFGSPSTGPTESRAERRAYSSQVTSGFG